jgi:hypothetical protein
VSSHVLEKLYDSQALFIFKKSDKDLSDNHRAAFAPVLRYGLG